VPLVNVLSLLCVQVEIVKLKLDKDRKQMLARKDTSENTVKYLCAVTVVIGVRRIFARVLAYVNLFACFLSFFGGINCVVICFFPSCFFLSQGKYTEDAEKSVSTA
jgi:hypothetical protein